MPKRHTFERTTFVLPDDYVLLRQVWIAAEPQDRFTFLRGLFPTLDDHMLLTAATLSAEEEQQHQRYILAPPVRLAEQ